MLAIERRKKLIELIQSVPDEKLPKLTDILRELIEDEDEAITEEEWAAIKEGEQQIANGEYVTLDDLIKKLDKED